MNINKTNYENYFLLYIDKELSVSEEAAVESFVHKNTQYANELASLQKAKLSPVTSTDKVIYPNKTLLYRLPEMEATLSVDFKNKLYKQSAAILQPSFKIKATLLSVAAIFILFIGYRLIPINSVSLPESRSLITSSTIETAPSSNIKNSNNTIVEKGQLIDNKLITTKKNNQSQPLVINSSIATNETVALADHEVTPILKEVQQNNSTSIIENISEKNEIAANENFTEVQNHKEAKEYKIIDTDETERTIYIANFEIDGTTLRGFTRRFNALFKKNKIEK